MSVKITSLEIQNIKRIKCVEIDLAGDSLIVGGKNCQGKTSILDTIMWTLLGDRYKPDNFKRTGSLGKASSKIELSNGLIVERKGKNGTLKIIDPDGKKNLTAVRSEIDTWAKKHKIKLTWRNAFNVQPIPQQNN